MKLAVSNIAWTNEEEEAVADKLQELGVKYVEIAPTKRWEDPTTIDLDEARDYVEWWRSRGIEVVAFQSMLFARPDLKIFESPGNRKETLDYMTKFIKLAGVMGAGRMVFGSPKNRQVSEMAYEDAKVIARDFFSELGDVAKSNGVALCLEPNAPQYNCDFVTNASEGIGMVRMVGNEGFGLHLDTACMYLAGDDLGKSIVDGADILKHYHISAPMLGTVDSNGEIDHTSAAKALRDIGYDGFVSIEMRPDEVGKNVARVEGAIKFAQQVYGV